jgi:HSP20 family protein
LKWHSNTSSANNEGGKTMFGLTPFNKSVVRRDNSDPFFDLVDDFMSNGFFPIRSLRHDTFKIDVKEEDNLFIIEADLPGVKKEEILIDYQDHQLIISIEREETKNDETKKYIHRERRLTKMKRAIGLSELDIDKIEATLKDGILTIKAPKALEVETKKRIQIK